MYGIEYAFVSNRQEHLKLLGKIVLGRAFFLPPFKVNSALDHEARFVHVVHGNSRLFVPNSQLDISTSDSFILKCEKFANHWLPNENESLNEVLIIHFYPDVLKYVYDDKLPGLFSSEKKINPGPVEKIEMNEMIDNFVNSIRYYFDHPALATDEFIKIKVREIILILMNSDHSGKIRTILSNLFQTNEYEFKEIIHSHLYEDLKLQDLAHFAGLSLSSFKRKFKSVFETSPARYIKTKRLEKAESLLRATDQRVSDVAYDCGFNDLAYFSKTFSSAFNCSPSEYRKTALSQSSN